MAIPWDFAIFPIHSPDTNNNIAVHVCYQTTFPHSRFWTFRCIHLDIVFPFVQRRYCSSLLLFQEVGQYLTLHILLCKLIRVFAGYYIHDFRISITLLLVSFSLCLEAHQHYVQSSIWICSLCFGNSVYTLLPLVQSIYVPFHCNMDRYVEMVLHICQNILYKITGDSISNVMIMHIQKYTCRKRHTSPLWCLFSSLLDLFVFGYSNSQEYLLFLG